MDLDALAHCTRCALSLTRQRVVIGAGPSGASLMVIGEAPGKTEDEGGEPFIGRSGQLLFRLIEEEVGLRRADCFVTNVVKCRPPDNRTPTRLERAACRPWWQRQLEETKPRAVLCVGRSAVEEVLGLRDAMGVVHGRVVALAGTSALATYHPAAALRSPNVVTVMRDDLRQLRALVAS